MKKILSLGLSFLLTGVLGSSLTIQAQETAAIRQETQANAPLTNQDILTMMKSGLSSEVIAAKVKVSANKFDTSPTALQELKAAGVPDVVMLAMVQASSGVVDNASGSVAGTEGVMVKVPDGTALELELMTNVSSNTAKEGDIVDFTVVRPVVVNGVTVIEKGAPAKARIAGVKKAGYWGKAGRVGWAMQDVLAADGNRVTIRMEKKATGDSKGGTVATATIVTAVVFWPAAPFWGFKRGKNATFPAGKRFEGFVHGDATVNGKAVGEVMSQTVDDKSAVPTASPTKP